MKSVLHVVCLNVPFPADYGGVIEIFYKLKALRRSGVSVILHVFSYGREIDSELREIVSQIHVYRRKSGFQHFFSALPYIVKTRISEELITNLNLDSHPVLCEGIHTTGIILVKPKLDSGRLFLRMHNNEPAYYKALAKGEKNLFRKFYFYSEALKLFYFERKLPYFKKIFSISETEFEHYAKKADLENKIVKLPAFHSNEQIKCMRGKGKYLLFHGNLSVIENHNAALYLIKNVFRFLNFPVIIAGNSPKKSLIRIIGKYNHIKLVDSPNNELMQDLVINAQCIFLYTEQNTGTKLKLLNSLFSGRFCISNSLINDNPALSSELILANSPKEFIAAANKYFILPFTDKMVQQRASLLSEKFNNLLNISILTESIFKV